MSALRRVGLHSKDENAPKEIQEVTQEGSEENHGSGGHGPRFDLNSNVSEEGSNFSAGERQLLALCRALVKESRVIVMDGACLCEYSRHSLISPFAEATSNVDVETDSNIQRTIQREFAECTLLCIAHRLNTIGRGRLALDTLSYHASQCITTEFLFSIKDRWRSLTRLLTCTIKKGPSSVLFAARHP